MTTDMCTFNSLACWSLLYIPSDWAPVFTTSTSVLVECEAPWGHTQSIPECKEQTYSISYTRIQLQVTVHQTSVSFKSFMLSLWTEQLQIHLITFSSVSVIKFFPHMVRGSKGRGCHICTVVHSPVTSYVNCDFGGHICKIGLDLIRLLLPSATADD